MKTLYRHNRDANYVVHVAGVHLSDVQISTKKGRSRTIPWSDFKRDFHELERINFQWVRKNYIYVVAVYDHQEYKLQQKQVTAPTELEAAMKALEQIDGGVPGSYYDHIVRNARPKNLADLIEEAHEIYEFNVLKLN